MAKPLIVDESPMNMAQVKDELVRIRKRDKGLNFRATRTEEYLKEMVSLDGKKAEELYSKLEGLNVPRLRDVHIHKIIDILPTNLENLKVVLQGYTLTVNNENLKKIVNVVNGYVEKK
ncbi:hypothetical protein HQ529_01465 [Candidatus Woesearchaeota archaeon]|nr:hypothetical protein [Candidatus Woesearchaeota archaeon]